MGDHDDPDALVGERADEIHRAGRLADSKRGGGLVEDDRFDAGFDDARDRDRLALAAGEQPHRSPIVREIDAQTAESLLGIA